MWEADGAPPFPEDGLTGEELFSGYAAEGEEPMPGEDMDEGAVVDTEGEPTPPHPESADVNPFIEPLFNGDATDTPAWSGLTYNEGGVSQWHLPIDASSVDVAGSSITVPADIAGPAGEYGEVTDNGDGTYTINSWPIDSLTDNGDGTVTIGVDIGPMA